MPQYIVKAMLQDVTKEQAYTDLDQAMAKEDGYPYITDENDKIWALPPDEYEFDVEVSAKELMNIVKLSCAAIEKTYKLKKTPIVVVEVADLAYGNLEELTDEDFSH